MHLQGRRGFLSHTHIDDFGGAEGNEPKDAQALTALQDIMHELGMVQADAKICAPSQIMVWLGIFFNTKEMYMAIQEEKMGEIMLCLEGWRGRTRATRKELQ